MTTGMHPTIGRQVHYHPDQNDPVEHAGARALPATITRVFSETTVNLLVLTDNPEHPVLVRTSVQEQPADRELSHATWTWPVIS